MKTTLFTILFLLLLAACQSEKDRIELSIGENTFNIAAAGDTLRVAVESTSPWEVENDATWYTVTKINHANSDSILISVPINIAREKRSGEITLSNSKKRLTLTINQAAATGEYHFKLPVIFHILYTTLDDPKQNIPATHIRDMLREANTYYNGTVPSTPEAAPVDMNLEFTLATHDPNGNLLEEPGIHRIYRENIIMNCNDFLNNKFDDARWLWNQNKYINVVVFTFTTEQIAGISFLAYVPSTHPLEGLVLGDAYFTSTPTKQAHCIALSNYYTFSTSKLLDGQLQSNFAQILVHELGHYLGLFHVFSRGENVESDYCDDTPDYNRAQYEKWLPSCPSLAEAYMRTSRDNHRFTSSNIMDYDLGWLNRFTNDQRTRVRHVLEYSPLIPGPKIPSNLTRGTSITEPGIIIE